MTQHKTLPIILDRLENAFSLQGITIKRSQALEIAAAAFGYRNSNALTAAAKAGEINPPEAEPIGTITLENGEQIIIARDVVADAPYAIDTSFLEQVAVESRAEQIGVTPYGHLARLARVLDYEPGEDITHESGKSDETSEIHVAIISHQYGTDVHLAVDRDGLDMQVAAYVRENWHEVEDYTEENPDLMLDHEVIEEYFDLCSNHGIEEYLEITTETIKGRIAVEPEQARTYPDRYRVEKSENGKAYTILDLHDRQNGKARIAAEVPIGSNEEESIRFAHDIAARLNGNAIPMLPEGMLSEHELETIANTLEEGSTADIWYDAHEYMDENNPDHKDTIAFDRIGNTQDAMMKAAEILRNHVEASRKKRNSGSKTVSIHLPRENTEARQNILERQIHEPIWITDENGIDNMSVTAADMVKLGLDFYKDREETLPLTQNEYEALLGGKVLNRESNLKTQTGFSVLYKGEKWIAPEVSFTFDPCDRMEKAKALEDAKAYFSEKKAIVERMGGHAFLFEEAADDEHEVILLLPFMLAFEASSVQDWEMALSWLMLPSEEQEERTRVIASFIPQIDIGRSIITAEPQGEDSWDATFDALRWGADYAAEILNGSNDSDDYATESRLPPKWVRDWIRMHPFEVSLEGLAELFSI